MAILSPILQEKVGLKYRLEDLEKHVGKPHLK
jgi:hypothetical protein